MTSKVGFNQAMKRVMPYTFTGAYCWSRIQNIHGNQKLILSISEVIKLYSLQTMPDGNVILSL